MKKRRVIILAAAGMLTVGILTAFLTGRQKRSIVGTWMARKVQLEHMSEPHRIEEIAKDFKNLTEKERQEAIRELKNFQVIFREDGTMEVDYDESKLLGTWKEMEDGVYLAVGGAGPHIITFTFHGEELDMEDDRETAILVLEKERI